MARKSLAAEKDEMGGTSGWKTTYSPPNDQLSLKGIGLRLVCGYFLTARKQNPSGGSSFRRQHKKNDIFSAHNPLCVGKEIFLRIKKHSGKGSKEKNQWENNEEPSKQGTEKALASAGEVFQVKKTCRSFYPFLRVAKAYSGRIVFLTEGSLVELPFCRNYSWKKRNSPPLSHSYFTRFFIRPLLRPFISPLPNDAKTDDILFLSDLNNSKVVTCSKSIRRYSFFHYPDRYIRSRLL
ncbi:hypothetical protein AVEN_48938-1 [Araneus ventricosus]|uniref:Uncharacterized protein n=1 Tax=Araneus ventricosus TaxID=182803 RepID=A0A4Y2AIF4_ARAVE|nr:hypothetical protein AVEN_48938-1 [Araneus ventricosus]